MSRSTKKFAAVVLLASLFLLSDFPWSKVEQTSAKADSRQQDKILEQFSVISNTVSGYEAWKHSHLHFLWTGYNLKDEPVAELYEIIPNQSSEISKAEAAAGYVVISRQSDTQVLEFGNHLPDHWLDTGSSAGRHYYLGPGGWFVSQDNHQDMVHHADSGDSLLFASLQSNWVGESTQNEDLKPLFEADTLIPEISISSVAGNSPSVNTKSSQPVLSNSLHAAASKVSTPDLDPLEGLGIAVESLNSPSKQAEVLKEGGWAVENFSTSNYFVIHSIKGLLTLSQNTESLQNRTNDSAQGVPSYHYLQLQNVFLPEASFYAKAELPYVWVSAKPGAM